MLWSVLEAHAWVATRSRQQEQHPSCPHRYIKKWQELIPVSFLMQLSTTICVMLLFAHVAACTLVLAAKLEGLPEGSWMVQYGAFEPIEVPDLRLWRAIMHAMHVVPTQAPANTPSSQETRVPLPADLVEQPAIMQYLYALFISTSHLFCLGYGLPTMPGSLVELCVTLVSMIVGSVLFLVVVGTLPTAILEQEVSAAAQELEGEHVPLPTARCATASSRASAAHTALQHRTAQFV